MIRFDHLRVPVTDLARSRRWYVALQDSSDFTIFLQQVPARVEPLGCALWFQIDDVDATHAAWSGRGVTFAHGPRKSNWDTGPSSRIPTDTSCASGMSAR